MQSIRPRFPHHKCGSPSHQEKFIVKSSWAEFALRALTVFWLLFLFSLSLFAAVLVPVIALTFMARKGPDGGTILVLPIEALLVRSVGHVGRLLMNSLNALFPTQDRSGLKSKLS